MNTEYSGFIEIPAVAVYFEKIKHGRNVELLLGSKVTGYGAGFVMPVGGHYEKSDNKNPIAAAIREGEEESGLKGGSNMMVANLEIAILGKRQLLSIDVVIFTNWTGELRSNAEFSQLQFYPFHRIPWKRVLPGDEKWMRKIFQNPDPQPLKVRMRCGSDRLDLKEITMEPLHPKRKRVPKAIIPDSGLVTVI